MPAPNSNPNQISSIAPVQTYGEQKQIDEQQAAAPVAPTSEATMQPTVQEPVAQMAPRESTKNIAGILPPLNMAPSNSGVRPLSRNQQVAYAIYNIPGVSGIARSLAMQLLPQRPVPFSPNTSMEEPTQEG